LPLVPFAGAPAAAVDAAGCLAVGLGAAMAAGQSAAAGMRRAAAGATGPQGCHPLAARVDPPFLALRETLGAAWTLRIAERFNAVAAVRGWPCRLRFGGLAVSGRVEAEAWQREAPRAFRAIARRFVSHGWLRRHGWY
jgi:hypothetical protein